jgi:hypothetical protein
MQKQRQLMWRAAGPSIFESDVAAALAAGATVASNRQILSYPNPPPPSPWLINGIGTESRVFVAGASVTKIEVSATPYAGDLADTHVVSGNFRIQRGGMIRISYNSAISSELTVTRERTSNS